MPSRGLAEYKFEEEIIVMTTLGSGLFSYEVSGVDFGKLPEGWTYREATAVAVNAADDVYVFNRGEHPVIVMDRNGKFLRSWGDGTFGSAHGVAIDPAGDVYCTDAGDHTVRKFTPDGRLLLTLGEKDKSSARLSGKPFNRPTQVAVDPRSGEIYVSDGYSNAAVHKFTPDGRHLFSWGDSGTDPGEFNTVHNIAVDRDGLVYVADRENQRVQVFDGDGKFQAQWKNLAKASCITIGVNGGEQFAYVGEMYAGLPENPTGWGNWTGKRLGPRVTVLDLQGNVKARVGDQPIGEATGQFFAPHGIAVDSRGDIYVAEVSYSIYGSRQEPPREVRSLQKLVRKG